MFLYDICELYHYSYYVAILLRSRYAETNFY